MTLGMLGAHLDEATCLGGSHQRRPAPGWWHRAAGTAGRGLSWMHKSEFRTEGQAVWLGGAAASLEFALWDQLARRMPSGVREGPEAAAARPG